MHRYDCSLPAAPESVTAARRVVARWLEEVGCPECVVADVRLAVSEAVTNVVLHGYLDRPADDVVLHAECDGEEIVVIVRDHGRGLAPRENSPGLGLGMNLIARVAQRVDIREPHDGGLELRMAFACAQ